MGLRTSSLVRACVTVATLAVAGPGDGADDRAIGTTLRRFEP
jgi:hypothetical protein